MVGHNCRESDQDYHAGQCYGSTDYCLPRVCFPEDSLVSEARVPDPQGYLWHSIDYVQIHQLG